MMLLEDSMKGVTALKFFESHFPFELVVYLLLKVQKSLC